MSFLIAVHVNEGIVLASDRRTTYTNTQTCGDTIIQRILIASPDSFLIAESRIPHRIRITGIKSSQMESNGLYKKV